MAPLAGAAEYIDFISEDGKIPAPNECPLYDSIMLRLQ